MMKALRLLSPEFEIVLSKTQAAGRTIVSAEIVRRSRLVVAFGTASRIDEVGAVSAYEDEADDLTGGLEAKLILTIDLLRLAAR